MLVNYLSSGNRRASVHPLLSAVCALGLVAAALALRLLILPVEASLPFLTFYPAATAAFYLFGRRAGLLALASSAALGYYIFVPPFWSWTPSRVGFLVTSAYVVYSLFAGWLIERMRSATRQSAAARRELANILEGQTEFVCRMKPDRTALFVNPAYCETFGVDAKAIVGARLEHRVSEEHRPLLAEACASLSPGTPRTTLEVRVLMAGDRWAWVQVNVRGYFDASGQLQEIQFVGRETSERKQLEGLLIEKADRIRDLYENAPSGYFSLDAAGRFVEVNTLMTEWLGCPREELLGKLGPMDFYTAEGRAQFTWNFPIFLATGRAGPLEFDLLSRDGSVRRVSVSATAIHDEAGVFVKSRSVMHDITAAHAAREQLRGLVAEQAAIIGNEMVGFVKLRNRRAQWSNATLAHMFGYPPEELDGQPARILYPDQASYENFGAVAYPELRAGRCYRTQQAMRRKDGTLIWVDISGVMLEYALDESLWTLVDVTAMHDRLQRTEYAALHDCLTGLANRELFDDRLAQALLSADRHGHRVAVCYLDLDGFKGINDQLGHEAGDQLLCEVGRRLFAAVRANDTVARPGGDEFVLLLTLLSGSQECSAIVARALQALTAPIPLSGGQQVTITASVGVVLASGQDGNTLLAQADAAMFQAKRKGKNQVAFHPAPLALESLPPASSDAAAQGSAAAP